MKRAYSTTGTPFQDTEGFDSSFVKLGISVSKLPSHPFNNP